MLTRVFIQRGFRIRKRKGSSLCLRLHFQKYSSYSTRSSFSRNIDQPKEDTQLRKLMVPNEPYSYLNYPTAVAVNEFKRHYMKIGDELDDEVIEAFKQLLEKTMKEFGNDYRSFMVQEKIQDLVDDMIIAASESQIIDIFECCCSKKFMINLSNKSLTKIFLFNSNAKLINRYRLLTTNFNEQKVAFIDFSKPLTPDQKKTILSSYPPLLLELFITQIYLPLGDVDKIEEFLQILKDQVEIKRYSKFKEVIEAIMYDQPFNIKITPESSIKQIAQVLSEYLNPLSMIPKALIDRFHSIVIAYNMRDCSLQQIAEYLAVFYPNFNTGLEIKHDAVISGGISSLIDDDQPSATVKKVFFQKLVNESNRKPYEELQILDIYKHDTLMKFSILERQFMSSKNEIPVQALDSYELPFFNKSQISNISDYYSHDFDKILGSIERNVVLCTLTEKETVRLLKPFNEWKRDVLMRALIKNNFNFRSESIVMDWIGESVERFDFVVTGGNPHILPENHEISKALKFLTPSGVLQCLTRIESNYAHSLVQLLPLKSNYYYILKKIQLMNLKPYPQNTSYIEILNQFLNEHSGATLNDEQLLEIYNIYITKVMNKNLFQGVVIAGQLIPSYKSTFLKLSGLSGNLIEKPYSRSLKLNATVPKKIILNYVKAYEHSGKSSSKVLILLFKNVLEITPDLRLGLEENVFLKEILHKFAEICIRKNFNPTVLSIIYKIALSKGLDSSWRIDDPKIISGYVERFVEAYASSDEQHYETNLVEMLSHVSNFQNRLKLSANATEIIFNSASEDEKIPTLNVLRKAMISVPYVESIADFIHEQIKGDNPKIYESFGLMYENPLVSDSKSKYYKWPKFDPRYFAPLIEKFMENIITKDSNNTFRRMFNDALANMNCDEDYYESKKFVDLYNKVTFFENPTDVVQSGNLTELMNSVKEIQEVPKQKYLEDPFVIHYLVSKGSTYKLETIVEMLYILTKGDLYLEKLGFWDLIDKPDVPPEFTGKSKFYAEMTESRLLNLHRLIFSSVKLSSSITPNELSYFTNISENIINCDLIEKRKKYMVINCVLIIIEKHSDLLSTFYKKMINIFPEYRVSVAILTSLLHSAAKNDFGEIDGILKHLVKNNDMTYLNQASEASISKLIADDENGLAQELYLKFCEFNPKFRIQEFAELNWKNNSSRSSKQNPLKNESEKETKLGKFKVKLYDYDALDGK